LVAFNPIRRHVLETRYGTMALSTMFLSAKYILREFSIRPGGPFR